MVDEKNPVKEAISLVAEGKNELAIDMLIKALDHADWSVRSYSAQILGELGRISGESGKAGLSKKIVETALNSMLEKMKSDSDGWVREAITKAIGKIGSYSPEIIELAIPYLIDVLTKDDHDGARGSAANTIGTIGKRSPELVSNAIEPLIIALKDEAWLVRYYAIYALGEIAHKFPDKKKTFISKIEEIYSDEDPGVRDIAKETVKKLSN
ncbi:MAG TPA: HEAT repeat domain-containing protein [Candidatus Deferrimicrobium sp.]|nr:HEAT repeat domain-containing protein [Candidatus Deferrimicrobium sp.]